MISQDGFELADASRPGDVPIPGVDGLFALCRSSVLRESVKVHLKADQCANSNSYIHYDPSHFE